MLFLLKAVSVEEYVPFATRPVPPEAMRETTRVKKRMLLMRQRKGGNVDGAPCKDCAREGEATSIAVTDPD